MAAIKLAAEPVGVERPEVAAAISAPLAQTDRIVVINSGADGGAGSSKVTHDVANIVSQVPATVEALTGVDLIAALQSPPGLQGMARDSAGQQKEAAADVEEVQVEDGE